MIKKSLNKLRLIYDLSGSSSWVIVNDLGDGYMSEIQKILFANDIYWCSRS